MKLRAIKYLILFVGLVSVGFSIIPGSYVDRWFKIAFHVLLFLFYSLSVKKLNVLLLLFLTSMTVGEFLVATDFEQYYKFILFAFVSFFTVGVMLLRPALSATTISFKWTDILSGTVVVAVLVYVISIVFFITSSEMENELLLAIAALAFVIFVVSCFYFAAFNDHPKRILVFITGIGYVVVCLGGLIQELIVSNTFLTGVINITEIAAQFSFVYFLIHLKEVLDNQKWFI